MDKQIDEMAKVMNECCNRYDEQGNHIGNKCFECECWCDTNHICCSYNTKEALALYNAGYRKSSEVAREIFEELLKEMKNWKYVWHQDYYGYGGDAMGYLSECVDHTIAELKKKYTKESEGTE